MGWVIAFVIVMVIGMCLDSIAGKIVIGAGVVALALLLLAWITSIDLFILLAKACAVVIVVVIAGVILLAIIGK